jgi:hypothetical protein
VGQPGFFDLSDWDAALSAEAPNVMAMTGRTQMIAGKFPVPASIAVMAVTFGASALVAAAAGAQSASPVAANPLTERAALIAQDPPYRSARLQIKAIPKGTAPAQSLFNGKDLSAWDSWLGVADPKKTYTRDSGEPGGLNNDSAHVFSVVQTDGAPAILINGKQWGALISRQSFSSYHLRLQFKWGEGKWMKGFERNSGIVYHSHGERGAFFKTFMSGIEFEIVPHSVGMLFKVGPGDDIMKLNDTQVGAKALAGKDASLPYPSRRYSPLGNLVPLKYPAVSVMAATDAEKPLGEWNTLDLYTVGNRSIHVVNGLPVMAAQDFTTTDGPGGKSRPLTGGRIQLQSEGAEIYFRDITIEPIGRLPRIVVSR